MAGRLDRVEIGYVLRAHGIRGEIRIAVHDSSSTALGRADTIHLGGEAFAVTRARPADKGWLVTLDGVGDRDRAESLKGRAVEVEREALELDDDELLLADLIGCTVVTASGESWGDVVAVEVGPQDRLVIRTDAVERLLPVVDELVLEVDVDAGRIVVDPPEGWPETPLSEVED